MPLSNWLVPPDQAVAPSEFRDYMLELHNAVYGLGSDVTGTLDSSNVPSVANVHTQNKDQYLDQGGPNQSTAANIKDAVTKKHDPGTNHNLLKQAVDPTNVSTTTTGTADLTYEATERDMLNALRVDAEALRDKVNTMMVNMRAASLIA